MFCSLNVTLFLLGFLVTVCSVLTTSEHQCFSRMTFLANLGHLNKDVPRSAMEEVVQRLSYADWLILYYLAQVSVYHDFDLQSPEKKHV